MFFFRFFVFSFMEKNQARLLFERLPVFDVWEEGKRKEEI